MSGTKGPMRMPARPATGTADGPVGHGDVLGRETGDQSPDLGFGRRPGGQAETSKPIDRTENQGDAHDGGGEPEAIRREADSAEGEGVLWIDGSHQQLLGTHLQVDQRGKEAHHPEGSNRLGHPALVAQRTKDRLVEDHPEEGLDEQRECDGWDERHRAADRESGDAGDREQESPGPQEGVGVGRVERLGTDSEVQYPRTAVGHHESHGRPRRRRRHCRSPRTRS